MFGLLHSHRLVFQGCREVGGGVSSFAFTPERPFEAKAGQHGILQLGGTAMKPFSLASAPEERSVLIGTSLQSGSSFKQRLAAVQPGDTVAFRGPANKFTLDVATPQVVMLAQGVGITPLRSMLAHAALSGMTIESSLIHVANAGHAYRDETQQWATTAAYPQHADDFRAAAAAAAHANPDATFFIAARRRSSLRPPRCCARPASPVRTSARTSTWVTSPAPGSRRRSSRPLSRRRSPPTGRQA